VHIILLVFVLFFAVAVAPAAVAQENMIKVIDGTGNVTEFEIPDEAVNAPVSPQVQTPKIIEPRKQESLRVKTAPRNEKSAIPANETTKYNFKTKRTESKKIDIKEGVAKKSAQPASIQKKRFRVALPGRKPLLPQKIRRVAGDLPPEMAIPKNLAIATAVQHAPPARDFKVQRRVHGGIPVYAVIFRTEDGPYTVLVDARSGKIVE